MEYVKCRNCGSEVPKVLTHCRECGERMDMVIGDYSDDLIQEGARGMQGEKVRAGFTTFYLWLGLVISALMLLSSIGMLVSASFFGLATPIFAIVASALMILGYWDLLKWRKMGFYIPVATSLASLIFGIFMGKISAISVLYPIGGLIILILVLMIKKNGKSCWDQLT